HLGLELLGGVLVCWHGMCPPLRVMSLVLTIALTSVGRRLLGQTWSVRQSGAHGCVASLCCGSRTRPGPPSRVATGRARFGVVRVSDQPERFGCPIVAAQDG